MSRQWMPLYIADYRKDTSHLSTEEHGAYLLLIMHYWATGGLPTDDGQLARITGMSATRWKRTKQEISKFFDAQWKHKRIDAELSHAAEISNKRKAAAEHRHSKSNANAPANAEQLDTQSQSPRKKEREEDTAGAVTSIYEFEAEPIRLTKKHFSEWERSFKNINLRAELLSLQEWAGRQPPGKWFHAVQAALAKRDRECRIAIEKEKKQPYKWNGMEGVV